MAILEHFLFNSDYPTDKLVFAKQGTITITRTWYANYDILPTGIGAPVYIEGDFRIQGADEIYPFGEAGTSTGVQSVVVSYMFNDQCYVVPDFFIINEELVGTKVDYRVWGYCNEQETKNIDIGGTASTAKPKLIIDSDNNYPRFVGDGYIAQGQTYNHNLGYMPIVRTWHKRVREVPTPDGGAASLMSYMPAGDKVYFGTPQATTYDASSIIQTTSAQIKTFTDEDTQEGDGIYFRMYTL